MKATHAGSPSIRAASVVGTGKSGWTGNSGTALGELTVNKLPVAERGVEAIAAALRAAAGDAAKDPVVVINADAKATHQSVVDVMQAAQQSGLPHISFATQQAQR